jgi:hypothetical protein
MLLAIPISGWSNPSAVWFFLSIDCVLNYLNHLQPQILIITTAVLSDTLYAASIFTPRVGFAETPLVHGKHKYSINHQPAASSSYEFGCVSLRPLNHLKYPKVS